jgi:hypothetical protein
MSFCAITKLTDLINIMKKIRIKYGMKNTHLLLFFFLLSSPQITIIGRAASNSGGH